MAGLKSKDLLSLMKHHFETDEGKELCNKIGLVYEIRIAPKDSVYQVLHNYSEKYIQTDSMTPIFHVCFYGMAFSYIIALPEERRHMAHKLEKEEKKQAKAQAQMAHKLKLEEEEEEKKQSKALAQAQMAHKLTEEEKRRSKGFHLHLQCRTSMETETKMLLVGPSAILMDRIMRSRDYPKDRSSRGGRERGDNNGYEYDRRPRRDYDRLRDYGEDRERRHRHKQRSRSRERTGNHSSSPPSSRSRSKMCYNKRTSFFDMPPPTTTVLDGADNQGQLQSASHGLMQTILPFNPTQLSLPLMPAQAMTQQATRHARRVYVGGLPPLANEQTIAIFFSGVMTAIGGNSSVSGDSVVNVYINHEKKFAFVEMRTVEEASNAMALDEIIFEGVAVRVRRPTDYNPALAATLGPSQPSPYLNQAAVGLTLGGGGITGTEGPERIFVGGIPYYFTEVQIRELVESFGTLRGFDLVKDKDTGNSKGYGFCVYQDPAVTDVACGALNGLKMGDKTLTVRRATVSSAGQSKSEQDNILVQAQQHIAIQKMALQAGGLRLSEVGMTPVVNAEPPTKILCLTQAISADELANDDVYEEILEDMGDECSKFGVMVNIVIPRPNQNGERTSDVGKVFLEYSDITGSANARNVLNGRKFGDNIVQAGFYPEDRFYSQDYSA